MKTLLRALPVVFVLWAGSSSVVLAVGVTDTKHNLSSTQTVEGNIHTDNTAIYVCGFCHSPHTEAGSPAPLWNRGAPSTAGYTMYSSPTLDMIIAGAPEGISLACLSCHDGSVAFDQLINAPGSGGYVALGDNLTYPFFTDLAETVPYGFDTLQTSSTAFIGQDLSGDHPISITYDDTADSSNGFVAIATVRGSANVRLYGDPVSPTQVECASCHDPHEDTNPTFLRVAAVGDLCTTCHSK